FVRVEKPGFSEELALQCVVLRNPRRQVNAKPNSFAQTLRQKSAAGYFGSNAFDENRGSRVSIVRDCLVITVVMSLAQTGARVWRSWSPPAMPRARNQRRGFHTVMPWTTGDLGQRINFNSRLCEYFHVFPLGRSWVGSGAGSSSLRNERKARRIEDAANRP